MSSTTSSQDTATPTTAILLVLATGVLFSLLDTSAKFLVVSGMSPQFIVWVRFAVHLVLVLLLFRAWSNPDLFRAQNYFAQALRGVFLVGSTIFNFLALRTLQLAETTSIYFFAPMVITALAGPMLGEWAGWRRWLAVIVGFVGVLVITRPGVATFELGHVFALISMLSYSLYVIMTRHMGARESGASLIFYSSLTPVIMMAPLVPATASWPPSALHWIVLLALGFFGGFGHWLLIRAYKMASPSALAPYPYFQMVWMILFGFLVFDQFPDSWTLGGATIIVASGLYIIHRERRLKLATVSAPNTEDDTVAKKL